MALPTSSVVALPPMSGVLGADRIGEDALDGADDGRRGVGMAQVLQHQRAGPDLADRIGDALARDIRRRAVHGLEQRRMFPLRVDVARRRDADRAADRRPEIGQDVAEEVGADDDVEALGRATKCAARMSMWNWSVRMPG